MKSMLIAVGGNSLIRSGEKGTVAEQLANARRTAGAILGLIRAGYHLVITPGSGGSTSSAPVATPALVSPFWFGS